MPLFSQPSLLNGEVVLGSGVNTEVTLNQANGTYQDIGITLSIPGPGTYLLLTTLRGRVNMASGVAAFISGKLYNSTDAADIANSEVHVIETTTIGNELQTTANSGGIVTFTAAKDIKLLVKRDGIGSPTYNTSFVDSDINGRIKLQYIKLSP
jgi:hypothetical protein